MYITATTNWAQDDTHGLCPAFQVVVTVTDYTDASAPTQLAARDPEALARALRTFDTAHGASKVWVNVQREQQKPGATNGALPLQEAMDQLQVCCEQRHWS